MTFFMTFVVDVGIDKQISLVRPYLPLLTTRALIIPIISSSAREDMGEQGKFVYLFQRQQ